MQRDSAKDGFDLIEYPCDYPLKAICRIDQSATSSALETIKSVVLETTSSKALLAIHSTQSRTGKFESITVTVRLFDRTELESVYQAVAALPLVVMTL